jgi:hypothetical protein
MEQKHPLSLPGTEPVFLGFQFRNNLQIRSTDIALVSYTVSSSSWHGTLGLRQTKSLLQHISWIFSRSMIYLLQHISWIFSSSVIRLLQHTSWICPYSVICLLQHTSWICPCCVIRLLQHISWIFLRSVIPLITAHLVNFNPLRDPSYYSTSREFSPAPWYAYYSTPHEFFPAPWCAYYSTSREFFSATWQFAWRLAAFAVLVCVLTCCSLYPGVHWRAGRLIDYRNDTGREVCSRCCLTATVG